MGTKGIKVRLMIIGILLCFAGSLIIFFSAPNSKTHREFTTLKNDILVLTSKSSDVFTEAEVSRLPVPVKKYFQYCGYIGTPKMQAMKAVYTDVDFRFNKEKPDIMIDYIQYNFVNEPSRIAYIDSSMYGIPFEGLDTFVAGKGSMKGVLAKLFTLFHQTGETMDQASLVTFLSECLMLPNVALQDYIKWEEIDSLHAKATIDYYDCMLSGIFTFRENGEMLSFTTDDRVATDTDGTGENIRWSVVFNEYEEVNGIRKPTAYQAIWHYDDGDLIYFDAKNVIVEFDPNY